MDLVLDASATLAWMVRRADPAEERLADEILGCVQAREALVPALWITEVANGVLTAERRGGIGHAMSASFMGLVNALPIVEDTLRPSAVQANVLMLARAYQL